MLDGVVRPPLSQFSKWCSPTFAKRSTGFGDATEKLRVMFQTIVEPVILRCKPDQNTGRTTVTSDHDLFVDGQAEVLRQIILDLGQGHGSRLCPRLASLARRATLGRRLS
jgi:hypothetical protein